MDISIADLEVGDPINMKPALLVSRPRTKHGNGYLGLFGTERSDRMDRYGRTSADLYKDVWNSKCRFVAQGFHQVKGLHTEEKTPPTPVQLTMRLVSAAMALEDHEFRHVNG